MDRKINKFRVWIPFLWKIMRRWTAWRLVPPLNSWCQDALGEIYPRKERQSIIWRADGSWRASCASVCFTFVRLCSWCWFLSLSLPRIVSSEGQEHTDRNEHTYGSAMTTTGNACTSFVFRIIHSSGSLFLPMYTENKTARLQWRLAKGGESALENSLLLFFQLASTSLFGPRAHIHRRKVCLFSTSAVVSHAALIWLWHYGASFPGESSFGREAALALARFLSPRKCVRADSGVSRAVHAIQHRPTTVGQVIAHIRRVAFTAKNQFFEFGHRPRDGWIKHKRKRIHT